VLPLLLALVDVSSFVVFVDTTRETVRSRLLVEVANPTWRTEQAELHVALPPGAAVTNAVLYIDERPMAGHLMSSDVAHDIYHSIVDKRRDPMLVAWAGPDAIDVSVFPVETHGHRRFEIEWVEPAGARYRIPVIGSRRPSMMVLDGGFYFPDGEAWVDLTPPPRRAPICPALVVASKPVPVEPGCTLVIDDGVTATDAEALRDRARTLGTQDVYYFDRRFAEYAPGLREHFALQTVTGERVWVDDSQPELFARAGGCGPPRAVTPDVSILVLEHEEDYARWAPPTTSTAMASAPLRMGARRVSRAPAIVMAAAPMIRGALDKHFIRRYVQHHTAEVRHCYEQQLITNHQLRGRVVLSLVLDSSLGGPAVSVRIAESTLDDPAVANCIVQRAGRWEFPRAEGGGIVEIHYPFVLEPTGG